MPIGNIIGVPVGNVGRSFVSSLLSRTVRPRRVGANANAVRASDLRRGFLDIEIDFRSGGFFAQLNWCLLAFVFAQRHSLEVRVSLVGDNYRVDPARRDWLPEFFIWRRPFPISEIVSTAHRKRIRDFNDLGFTITPDLTLAEAHRVFFSMLAVHPQVLAGVDGFVAEKFRGRVLGIHYRGTDKGREAPPVSYESVTAQAAELAEAGNFETVFVASDEARFVTLAEASFPRARVVSWSDHERSSDGRPVHHRTGGSRIGYDALSNALLLSRCEMLLRTASSLSAWSAIFNPALTIRTLNTPYAEMLWYPEREILRDAATRSVG